MGGSDLKVADKVTHKDSCTASDASRVAWEIILIPTAHGKYYYVLDARGGHNSNP